METYFAMGLLTLGIQIVDIRHKPTRDDMTMAEWFRASGKPWVIIANKLDKIKKSQLEGNIAEIRQTLLLPEEVPVIPFSAEKGMRPGGGPVDLIFRARLRERKRHNMDFLRRFMAGRYGSDQLNNALLHARASFSW